MNARTIDRFIRRYVSPVLVAVCSLSAGVAVLTSEYARGAFFMASAAVLLLVGDER